MPPGRRTGLAFSADSLNMAVVCRIELCASNTAHMLGRSSFYPCYSQRYMYTMGDEWSRQESSEGRLPASASGRGFFQAHARRNDWLAFSASRPRRLLTFMQRTAQNARIAKDVSLLLPRNLSDLTYKKRRSLVSTQPWLQPGMLLTVLWKTKTSITLLNTR